jgi:GAF domain-containing protein
VAVEGEGQALDDLQRLAELGSLPLADAEIQAALDAITARAAEAFGLPISLVSIVLDSAQFFAGATGLGGWLAETRGTPVEWAFCRNVVEGSDPFLVEDATKDERVAENPLVTQDGIRCYLGVPLKTAQGNRLGSLCVIGVEPREFSEEEIARLREFAQEAVQVLEQRSS